MSADNPFGENNLYHLCMKYLGTSINCTCDMFQLKIDGKMVDFCMYVGKQSIVFSAHHSKGQMIYAVITLMISILGVFGNITVLLSYRKRKLTFHQKLVNMLAVFDLLFAVVAIIYIVPLLWTSLWYYGEWGCKIFNSMVTLGAFVAIGVIFIIAVERYYGIVHPFSAGISTNFRSFSLLVINVLLALVSAVPRMIFLHVHRESRQCTEEWSGRYHSTIYSWTLFILYSIIPVLIISLMYRMIHKTLNKSGMVCKVLTGTVNNKIRIRRLQDNKRIMKRLVSVLVVFVLCTFPNKLKWLVFDMLNGFQTINSTTYSIVNYVCDTFYFFHVLVNPLVYTISDKTFRQKVKVFLGSGRKQRIFLGRRKKNGRMAHDNFFINSNFIEEEMKDQNPQQTTKNLCNNIGSSNV